MPYVRVDRSIGISIERQVYGCLRQAVREGRLRPGLRLPSSRELAKELGVSRNAVIAAFERLILEGYLSSHAGSGTYVAANPQTARFAPREERRVTVSRWGRAAERLDIRAAVGVLTPNAPAVDEFPRRRWMQLLTRYWQKAPLLLSASDELQGIARLRNAIADHVVTMRGITCSPDDVIITAGPEQGLDVVTRLFADPGDAVLVEDPSDSGVRGLFDATALRCVPATVGAEGLELDLHYPTLPRLAYVTPSRQNPLGGAMTLGRRYQLMEWAKRNNVMIIEDDRDCGLDDAPTAGSGLKAIDTRGHVVYVGSFSKTLFPGIGIGYVVAPNPTVDLIARARALSGRVASPAEQAALADFIIEGDFARHLRRMQEIYSVRREVLSSELRRQLGDALASESPGCALQTIAWLAPEIDDTATSNAALLRGVDAPPLSSYCIRTNRPPALILGYGALTPAQIPGAVERLAAAVETVKPMA